jgi:hypothetical protein
VKDVKPATTKEEEDKKRKEEERKKKVLHKISLAEPGSEPHHFAGIAK